MKIFVGTDLIEIERIKKSCQSRRFCERVYSEKELTLFHRRKPIRIHGGELGG